MLGLYALDQRVDRLGVGDVGLVDVRGAADRVDLIPRLLELLEPARDQ